MSDDFTKLYLELEREGLFEPSYIHNVLRMVELFMMAALGYYLLQWQNSGAKLLGIALIGLMQGRSGWIQHESGHHSFSGNPKFDRFFHAVIFGKFFLFIFFVCAIHHNDMTITLSIHTVESRTLMVFGDF